MGGHRASASVVSGWQERTGRARPVDDWRIRAATEADVSSVLSVWAMAGGPSSVSDTPEGLLRLLAVEREGLLIAEVEDALVGSLIAAWDGWRGSFYRLVVRPDHRRRGLATALLREGERRLRERGAGRLTAIVAQGDPAAIGFWKALGYEQQPDRRRFIRAVED